MNGYCMLLHNIAPGKYIVIKVEYGLQLHFKIFLNKSDRKLEDLKVLRRSPDLFNYVEIGQGQLQLIIKHILFYHIWGLQPFWSSDLKQSNEYSINIQ